MTKIKRGPAPDADEPLEPGPEGPPEPAGESSPQPAQTRIDTRKKLAGIRRAKVLRTEWSPKRYGRNAVHGLLS